jgi:acyl-CoA dehydrogenase
MSGASAVHINIFGLQPVVVFGTEEQKRRMLPPLIAGKDKACFAVTEPDAGLDTTAIKVRADRRGDHYVLSGQKIWISTAQVANKILILARTTPIDQVTRKTQGLSLFYTDLDRSHVAVRVIEKMGRHAVDSNEMFFDGMVIPAADLIGAEGEGFRCILHGMNPERILIAAEAVGIGRAALHRAAGYARERVVFGRPIGQNQGVQFPIAKAYAAMRAAELMVREATRKYEAGLDCGAEANMAKMLAADASWEAANACVQTHGGFGFAEEYDVERKFRETRLYQVAPISTNLILSFVAEHVLGLPRSY